MKKLIKSIVALLVALSMTAGLCACDLFGGSNNGGSQGAQGVSYGTATVNFHYEYDVFVEHYWQEKYSIPSGKSHELTELYTPPMKAGYRFMGWTMQKGGAGDLIGTPFTIVGSGFGGTVYDLYAKYEEIPFEVVYHLDGGENHADNPTSLTGKRTLKNPTKEKHQFLGWYRDPEFTYYTTTASMTDDETTTIDLYARWERVYTVSYLSNQPKVKVVGDQSTRPVTSFTADYQEFIIRLTPEYFENYYFLGWEIEEGGELVQSIEIPIDPKEVTDDLTYTAHYLAASNPANTAGLRTMISNGKHYFYAREEVKQIVVEDMYGSKYYEKTQDVTVYYSGEEPPEVICRDDVKVYLERNPEEVEKHF